MAEKGGMTTPMNHSFPQPPKGTNAGGGDVEGWSVMNELGAPKAAADEPLLQITQDIGAPLNGRTMPMPKGTEYKP